MKNIFCTVLTNQKEGKSAGFLSPSTSFDKMNESDVEEDKMEERESVCLRCEAISLNAIMDLMPQLLHHSTYWVVRISYAIVCFENRP